MTGRIIPLYRQDFTHPQAQACARCGVREVALFGALPDEALDQIHQHIAEERLAPRQALFELGHRADALYTVRSGVLQLERVNERGDRRVVRLAGRGDLLGLEAMLLQPYGATAVACTQVEVCRIPRSLLQELSASQPSLSAGLMQRWQQALSGSEEWLVELSMGPSRRRVLQLLRKLSEYAEPAPLSNIWLPSREDMGAMLNMTIETASRMVSSLKREGVLLDVQSRQACLNTAALAEALQAADGD